MKATRIMLCSPGVLRSPRRRRAEQRLPERFEVRIMALALLRHRMQIAEAALEWIIFENRRRAGGVVGEINHLARLLDRVSRDDAVVDALLVSQAAAACHLRIQPAENVEYIGA